MMTNERYWVFAYGSLMWRPGFDYLAAEPAMLHGAHRCLCIYSENYRGTKEKPGLVLGLDQGGSCRGVAFSVAANKWQKTLSYLREREMVRNVYKEVWRPVKLMNDNSDQVSALCFQADRSHSQYTGPLDIDHKAKLICNGYGNNGANLEYVERTVWHLEKMGVYDRYLSRIHKAVMRHLKDSWQSEELKID